MKKKAGRLFQDLEASAFGGLPQLTESSHGAQGNREQEDTYHGEDDESEDKENAPQPNRGDHVLSRAQARSNKK